MNSILQFMLKIPSRWKVEFLICAVLVVLICLIYGQTYNFSTALLEETVSMEVSQQHGGFTLNNVKTILSKPIGIWWSPVSFLACMLDTEFFGDNPGPRHLVNVVLHIFSTLLLFLTFSRATGAVGESGLLAALFAVHPLNVEPVAWIALHESSTSMFFMIATLLAYTYYAKAPDKKKYCLVFFFYILGLMSHPRVIVLPLLLLLFDYWPLRRVTMGKENVTNQQPSSLPPFKTTISVKNCIKEKIPFLAIACLWVIGSLYWLMGSFSQLMNTGMSIDFSVRSHLMFIFVSYATYLIKIFVPINLIADHCLSGNALVITNWQIIFSVILLITISVLFLIQARKGDRFYLMGWVWFLLAMAPAVMIGAVKQVLTPGPGRFAYLGAIGIFVVVIWGSRALFDSRRYNMIFGSISVVSVILALTYLSRQQTSHWRNEITLYQYASSAMPHNQTAYQVLGDAFMHSGQVENAIQAYSQALQIDSGSAVIYNKLGLSWKAQGDQRQALQYFKEAIQLNPGYAAAHHNLGDTLLDMGDIDNAIIQYEKALKNNPYSFKTHNSLAAALVQKNQFDEARHHLQKALEINPNYTTARHNLRQIAPIRNP